MGVSRDEMPLKDLQLLDELLQLPEGNTDAWDKTSQLLKIFGCGTLEVWLWKIKIFRTLLWEAQQVQHKERDAHLYFRIMGREHRMDTGFFASWVEDRTVPFGFA
ncbi:uncharacterized protein LOC142590946 [Dermacentor variabilis]|uniref:uncharacterized protein LOC142590946 n=1 Tax=Dermacentor variabilis TaxID=34621 RepID=UPI003F5BDD6A